MHAQPCMHGHVDTYAVCVPRPYPYKDSTSSCMELCNSPSRNTEHLSPFRLQPPLPRTGNLPISLLSMYGVRSTEYIHGNMLITHLFKVICTFKMLDGNLPSRLIELRNPAAS
ncbi:hypothetical protein BDDG_13099 [Blastomyces dermatitidis ATCC 18188]|uniref:Uncharacterized protein n=1 Tax=Ajellomyces dermatitidis (strain ATCC 18188 / CBS 674.68) TaxID=653446 RepID=A0A0J9HI81_AJEDA|nr:hypothetical protein BDDG_13099 [Blastomyces dermatitidis ATCC 18188]